MLSGVSVKGLVSLVSLRWSLVGVDITLRGIYLKDLATVLKSPPRDEVRSESLVLMATST